MMGFEEIIAAFAALVVAVLGFFYFIPAIAEALGQSPIFSYGVGVLLIIGIILGVIFGLKG